MHCLPLTCPNQFYMKAFIFILITNFWLCQTFAQTLTITNNSDCNMLVTAHAMDQVPPATCTANYNTLQIFVAAGTTYTATVADLTVTPAGTWLWYSADIADATSVLAYNFGNCTFTDLSNCNTNPTVTQPFFIITNGVCPGTSSMTWTNNNSCNDLSGNTANCVAGICKSVVWTNSGINSTLTF